VAASVGERIGSNKKREVREHMVEKVGIQRCGIGKAEDIASNHVWLQHGLRLLTRALQSLGIVQQERTGATCGERGGGRVLRYCCGGRSGYRGGVRGFIVAIIYKFARQYDQ